ncbi:MAG: spore germination protein GerPC [Anaerobacillus sp.]|uniref:spore germination protein GerPC n=1 Tax=Anaerobacillus sp. TaxID=1872506 RepID=UPI00391BBAA9
MYYYQWPYTYYYNQSCYWGCTDPSQCQYQQHQQQYMQELLSQQYGEDHYTNQQYYQFDIDDQNNKKNNKLKQLQVSNDNQMIFNQEYTNKVIQALDSLQQKIEEVEKENEELKEKVENIKPINIENINYKIQELTVEELSGTLNIGLSALTDAENLKKLLEEKGEIKFNDIDTQAMENMEEMEDFNAQ